MDDKRRFEIRQIVDFFKNTVGDIPQETILAYCQRMGFENVMAGDLKDYTAQVNYDNMVATLYPLILAELQKLAYTPEFASEAERKKIRETNDEVRVNITKAIEQAGVSYILVDGITKGIAKEISGAVEGAGTTAFNKAMQVLLHLAHKRFGGDFTMKHAADYAIEIFTEEEKRQKEASSVVV